MNGVAAFAARTNHGLELWRSDGINCGFQVFAPWIALDAGDNLSGLAEMSNGLQLVLAY